MHSLGAHSAFAHGKPACPPGVLPLEVSAINSSAHPSSQMAIGHWPEVLFPAFSSLQLQPGFRPARVLLMSLKRTHLMAWARTFMGVALSGTQPTEDLAPIVFQSESDSVWHQIRASGRGCGECSLRLPPMQGGDSRALALRSLSDWWPARWTGHSQPCLSAPGRKCRAWRDWRSQSGSASASSWFPWRWTSTAAAPSSARQTGTCSASAFMHRCVGKGRTHCG